MTLQHPIVLFDGECNLCNVSVRFLLTRDPLGRLRFANLQSDAGKAMMEKLLMPVDGFDSLALVEGERVFTHSTGALRTTHYLRFPWPVLGKSLSLIPAPIRDFAYNWIARNRFAWFGKTDTCQTPTQNLQRRFLN